MMLVMGAALSCGCGSDSSPEGNMCSVVAEELQATTLRKVLHCGALQ
jgi:hypothetical protein